MHVLSARLRDMPWLCCFDHHCYYLGTSTKWPSASFQQATCHRDGDTKLASETSVMGQHGVADHGSVQLAWNVSQLQCNIRAVHRGGCRQRCR